MTEPSRTPRTRTETIMQRVRAMCPNFDDIESEIAALEADLMQQSVALSDVTSKVREIHGVMKRGAATEDHGLDGNLACILDGVCTHKEGAAERERAALETEEEWILKLVEARNERDAAMTYAEALQTTLGSLQEMLAKQLIGLEDCGICSACGSAWKPGEPDTHADDCPVGRGLAIIEAALAQPCHEIVHLNCKTWGGDCPKVGICPTRPECYRAEQCLLSRPVHAVGHPQPLKPNDIDGPLYRVIRAVAASRVMFPDREAVTCAHPFDLKVADLEAVIERMVDWWESSQGTGYEATLRLIASRGVKTRVRPTGEKQALGCDTCYHWWDVGEEEHHSEHCAYVIARDALHGGNPK